MYSAYKLNKQSDNIQPWHTHFPIWNQSIVPCPVLTVASWPAHRFLKRQVRRPGVPISWRIFQFVVIHTVKPGEGNGNPFQYSCLENLMDRGAWQEIVHGVARVGDDLATKQHSQRLWCSQQSRSRYFSGTLLIFLWSSGYWQFDHWFLCLF